MSCCKLIGLLGLLSNFERQADLHAFSETGGSGAIVNALEKVAWLSGNIRELPSWHHFGVGQRVDYLLECERDPSLVQKHHKMVLKLLLAYGLLIVISVAGYMAIPSDYLESVVAVKIEETLLRETVANAESPNVHWMLGDFYYRQERYVEAVQSYQQSLLLREDNPEVHNNLAWIFVTSQDVDLRDINAGLVHAHRAVELLPAPHILDTFAHSLWGNGHKQEALQVEQRALTHASSTGNAALYKQQIEIWREM
jgi:tetratricopeptide (TPR) repeat protein